MARHRIAFHRLVEMNHMFGTHGFGVGVVDVDPGATQVLAVLAVKR